MFGETLALLSQWRILTNSERPPWTTDKKTSSLTTLGNLGSRWQLSVMPVSKSSHCDTWRCIRLWCAELYSCARQRHLNSTSTTTNHRMESDTLVDRTRQHSSGLSSVGTSIATFLPPFLWLQLNFELSHDGLLSERTDTALLLSEEARQHFESPLRFFGSDWLRWTRCCGGQEPAHCVGSANAH